MLIGTVGSICIIYLFIRLNNSKPNVLINNLCTLGEKTLALYVIQTLVIETILCEFINLKGINTFVYSFLICPTMSVLILLISYYLYKILSRNKYMALILFGESISSRQT